LTIFYLTIIKIGSRSAHCDACTARNFSLFTIHSSFIRCKGTTIPRNRLYIICGGFYHIFRKRILTTTPSISNGVIDNGTMCLLQKSASKVLNALLAD